MKITKTKTTMFMHEHDLKNKKLRLKTVCDLIVHYNAVIVEFRRDGNDKDIADIIKKLNVEKKVRERKSFVVFMHDNNRNSDTYSSVIKKFVFIYEDLDDNEKLEALLHELGHLVLDHSLVENTESFAKQSEKEAKYFTKTILKSTGKHWRKRLAIAVPAVLAASAVIFTGQHMKNLQRELEASEARFKRASEVRQVVTDMRVVVDGSPESELLYHRGDCVKVVILSSNFLVEEYPIYEAEALPEHKPCPDCLPEMYRENGEVFVRGMQ